MKTLGSSGTWLEVRKFSSQAYMNTELKVNSWTSVGVYRLSRQYWCTGYPSERVLKLLIELYRLTIEGEFQCQVANCCDTEMGRWVVWESQIYYLLKEKVDPWSIITEVVPGVTYLSTYLSIKTMQANPCMYN